MSVPPDQRPESRGGSRRLYLRKHLLAACALLLLASVPIALIVGSSAAGKVGAASPTAGVGFPDAMAGRVLRAGAPSIANTSMPGTVRMTIPVMLGNTGSRPFLMQPGDFSMMAEGDMFGQASAPSPANALSGMLAPGVTRSATLVFLVPAAAVHEARLFYHPSDLRAVSSTGAGSVTFPGGSPLAPNSGQHKPTPTPKSTATATPRPTATPTATPMATATATATPTPPPSGLAIIRAKIWQVGSAEPTAWILAGASQAGLLNPDPGGAGGSWDQTGTGESINYVCYAYVASGSAFPCGSGTAINTLEDTFARPNQTGWGTSTNSDGVPNVSWGMDGNGSLSTVTISNNTGSYAYPGSTNVVGIASAGSTAYNGGDALVEFSVSAVGHATPYVVENACPDKSCYYGARLHTSANLLEIAERAGGATNILASAPFTPSAGTLYWMRLDVSIVSGGVSEHTLASSAQDPWGTAVDSAGNVWFAEAGCDFGQSCSSTTPPGQIGEIVAATQAINYYTLPNLSGNQPCFVALDGSGNVWFTTPNNSMIGELSPSTHTFVGQWSVTSGSGPWDLTVSNGKIWYTEHYVSAVGEFDPSTNRYTDFQTPTANSNPYGITANDPVNGNLIWFTENNGNVARIGVLDTSNNNAISEYLIRAQLPGSNLTPHLIALDGQGNPWWTEGWTRDIGKLVPSQATVGHCGTISGDCVGVTEYALPNTGSCSSSHVSGIAMQGSQFVWLDDSLAAQVATFDPTAQQFTMYDLTNCGAHPHDGLNLDTSSNVWWDEEFANNLGELTP